MLEISERSPTRSTPPSPEYAQGGRAIVDEGLEPLVESLLTARSGIPSVALAEADYAIRMPRFPRHIHCPHCRRSFRAAGPTGYDEGGPICDICLLDRAEDLGMLLALASAIRAFASYRSKDGEKYLQALGELGIVARLYERLAIRSGPPRPFRIAARMGGEMVPETPAKTPPEAPTENGGDLD